MPPLCPCPLRVSIELHKRYWLQSPEKRMTDLDLSRPSVKDLLIRQGEISEYRKTLSSLLSPYADFSAELLDLWIDWTTPASEKLEKSAESLNVGVADTPIPRFSGVKDRRFHELGKRGDAEESADDLWAQLFRLP